MSSFAPPPPPPGAAPPATPAAPARPPSAAPRRMPVQPPALSTAALSGVHHANAYLPTPADAATPSSAPFSPYAASSNVPSQPSTAPTSASRVSSPMAFRGPSLVSAYNPQEWGRRGQVGGSFMPHSSASSVLRTTREATGMEANMPSPPPPYSPNPGQTMPQAMHSSPQIGSGAFAAPQGSSPRIGLLSQSPPATMSTGSSPSGPGSYDYSRGASSSSAVNASSSSAAPSFPPPPPRQGRDRSTSRTRDKHSVFSFSALTLRNRTAEPGPSHNAIDALRQQTTEVLARTPPPVALEQLTLPSSSQGQQQWSPEIVVRPPASRRAASTGGIGMTVRSEDNTSPGRTAAWEPGMPLPPPPPGPPPPSSSRSQSMNRTSEISSRAGPAGLAAPASRRPPHHGSTLGPIPPTPADWTEEEARNRSRSPYSRALRITTPDPHGRGPEDNAVSAAARVTEAQTAHPSTSSSNTGLIRASARRDPSARGIRERRSESRAARERVAETQSALESSNNPWARDMEAARPANLVLTADEGAISQRRKGKGTPRSGQLSGRSAKSSGELQTESSESTPRLYPLSGRIVMSPRAFAPTPPFSPATEGFEQNGHGSRFKASPAPPPKTLPTPPPNSSSMSSNPSSFSSPKEKERPVSHILHTPIDNVSMPAPLMPSRPSSSAGPSKASKPLTDQELFTLASIDRHHAFIERESAAVTDQERLELFADFIVNESRLRRDRYPAAFEAMASDILDLTRDMWRSYNPSTGRRSTTPNMGPESTPSERKDSMSSVSESQANASPATSSANYSPRLTSDSPISSSSGHGPGRPRNDSTSWQPCLSPIPSMAVSTVPEEEDSRGRSASRWWEGSAEDSQGRGGKKLARSKRESKYMGVPLAEAQEYIQYAEADHSPSQSGGTPGPSETAPVNYAAYGPDEYPPEKAGWHEQSNTPNAPPPSTTYYYWNHSAPTTPDPYKLDVSRLVTLPPPYPRHHPAVNNNHPDLASIRANLRTLGDPADAMAIKERYRAQSDALREKATNGANARRAELREEIQDRIRTGEMSFSDAAKAEADFDATEAQITQRRVQQDFDMFQRDVMTPLHALLSERIRKATASMVYLKSELSNDAQKSNPNQTQEEGDEQPELLEKLTLLKWLFEAREQLHKELFGLENERNDIYKRLVLTPYKLANNQEKVREAQDFFARDTQDRTVTFEKQTLRRFEDFIGTVEENVTRGVEGQLSAFWDIAPGLLAVVQKVPERLTDEFAILIPPGEYGENPSYHAHPLQYLYSLLAHAQKSAYQFIESQTNLLCLLHEVKSGVMTANTRLLGTQRVREGEDRHGVEAEMGAIRSDEEQRLTEDLKEKVSLVEGQWSEALGGGLAECMERVQVFLVSRGGWDEGLQE